MMDFASGLLIGAGAALVIRQWIAIRRVRYWLHKTNAGQRYQRWAATIEEQER